MSISELEEVVVLRGVPCVYLMKRANSKYYVGSTINICQRYPKNMWSDLAMIRYYDDDTTRDQLRYAEDEFMVFCRAIGLQLANHNRSY